MENKTDKKPVDGVVVIDKAIDGFLKLFAIVCVGAGIYSGKWHCFMLAGMLLALLWAIKVEDKRHG